MTRRIVYPDYAAACVEGGDIRLRFYAPGSKFGPVEVFLVADDAESFVAAIDKALNDSCALLAADGEERS